MEPDPIPDATQVELDARLDDDGRPLAEPDPPVPDDVQEEDLPKKDP